MKEFGIHGVALNALAVDGVHADGRRDDTEGLQKALASADVVWLPRTENGYLISRALRIRSGQTLIADPCASIRLADWCRAHMLENSDQQEWQHDITVIGGIWDGNNEHQSCHYHDTARYDEGFYGDARLPYEPSRYAGILMRFDKVSRLTLRGITLKDPEAFATQIGNVEDFLIEDIRFDFNMKKFNMDGIHIHGNSRRGLIRNIHGSTNDDMVALNADDGPLYEMSRGPIEDVVVDGLYAGERGFTGVRMLSCGSPVRRIRVANVFGRFKMAGVYLSHHNVHPGEPVLFEDIAVDGLWFSRCRDRVTPPIPPEVEQDYDPERYPIWVAPGARVRNLSIRNLMRRETHVDPCVSTIRVFGGGKVDFLEISGAYVSNTGGAIGLLENCGEIGQLCISGAWVEAPAEEDGFIVRNDGVIGSTHAGGVAVADFAHALGG